MPDNGDDNKKDIADPTNEDQQLSTVHQSFSGPMPPPALFREYDQILPGAAERIMAMAEKEQQHRHVVVGKVAEKIAEGENQYRRAGARGAHSIIGMLVLGGLVLLGLGRYIAGSGILIVFGGIVLWTSRQKKAAVPDSPDIESETEPEEDTDIEKQEDND